MGESAGIVESCDGTVPVHSGQSVTSMVMSDRGQLLWDTNSRGFIDVSVITTYLVDKTPSDVINFRISNN